MGLPTPRAKREPGCLCFYFARPSFVLSAGLGFLACMQLLVHMAFSGIDSWLLAKCRPLYACLLVGACLYWPCLGLLLLFSCYLGCFGFTQCFVCFGCQPVQGQWTPAWPLILDLHLHLVGSCLTYCPVFVPKNATELSTMWSTYSFPLSGQIHSFLARVENGKLIAWQFDRASSTLFPTKKTTRRQWKSPGQNLAHVLWMFFPTFAPKLGNCLLL